MRVHAAAALVQRRIVDDALAHRRGVEVMEGRGERRQAGLHILIRGISGGGAGGRRGFPALGGRRAGRGIGCGFRVGGGVVHEGHWGMDGVEWLVQGSAGQINGVVGESKSHGSARDTAQYTRDLFCSHPRIYLCPPHWSLQKTPRTYCTHIYWAAEKKKKKEKEKKRERKKEKKKGEVCSVFGQQLNKFRLVPKG